MVRSNWEKLQLSIQGLFGVVIITAAAFLVLLVILGYHWVDRGANIRRPTASQLSATRDQRMAQYMLKNMIYFKDDRTGLCFAAIETDGGRDASLTCVPCEAVQDLLVKPFEPAREPEPEPRNPNNNYIHR